MHKLSRLFVAASAAALLVLSSGVVRAQGTAGGGTAPAPPSPAAPEPKASENAAPESAASSKKAASRKKKPTRMTRQQELDRSIDRGTVPARYRNSVPKEYHQYIPFDKQ